VKESGHGPSRAGVLAAAPRVSLRRDVALTIAGLSALCLLSLGCVYVFTEFLIERRALLREENEQLHTLMDLQARGEMNRGLAAALGYFPAGEVPPALAGLPPGTFRRVQLDGHPVQVITAADHDGGMHALVHDLTVGRQREKSLLFSLLAGLIVAGGGAWLASGRLARRILSPLSALVEQIRRIDPHRPGSRPVTRTGDAELDSIPESINALIGELDHVLQRERAFADAASHELRTPLAVVRSAIDLLRERGESPPAIVDRMDRAARRAQDDLTALLAMSPAREPPAARLVDLRELLPAAGDPYLQTDAEPGGGSVGVVWEWGERTEVLAEPTALGIVFTNLLRNALRAAPAGVVRVQADAERVRVVDDGEGLPEGWPENPEPRGRGLGLSIARILAERNGWKVEVSGAESRGCIAELVLRTADRPGRDASASRSH
jgi:signal transduction histidine kinase